MPVPSDTHDDTRPFEVTQEALEALGWPAIVALWADECRTPQGRASLLGAGVEPSNNMAAGETPARAETASETAGERMLDVFATTPTAVRGLQGETGEARALLDAERLPPLGRPVDASELFERARRGRLLDPRELLDVAACAAAVTETRAFLKSHAADAPALAALGEPLVACRELVDEVERCIERSGEISDRASSALAKARREKTRLAGELQRKLERFAKSSDVAPHLSDDYVTVRNDRYVLPVRAESRGAVHGIVHDASRSGTTLFVEPEAVVDMNNRLKQADLSILRECERVLRELTESVARDADALERSLAALGRIDLAFARGRLARRMQAVSPRVEREGVLELPGLRHPLLPADECVANDLRIGADFSVLVLSGPNAGGKTVGLKAMGLAALMVRAGLQVPCDEGARVDCMDAVLADIGDGQDIAQSLSTFSAHMRRLADTVRRAGPHSLVVLDEVGVGTDPAEGAALAQALLEALASRGARVVTTTHYNLLKEKAAARADFENASVEFDAETLEPTYRVRIGAAGPSAAAVVARRMGMPDDVLARAEALLGSEDRRLEEALAELASGRAALDEEREVARRIREEGESARARFGAELEKLRAKRDTAFTELRGELDAAFKEAHAEVAGLIRALQRGGTARKAAEVREQLLALEEKVEREAEERGVLPEAPEPDESADAAPVDWARMKVGDRVRVPGGHDGVLETLPDRAGRVRVRTGGARLTVEAARLTAVGGGGSTGQGDRRDRVRVTRNEDAAPDAGAFGGTTRIDLRGQRVDEALDRLGEALDRAAADGRDELVVVHGHGTGALRDAVRKQLARSPYVIEARAGDEQSGGNGITTAAIGRR